MLDVIAAVISAILLIVSVLFASKYHKFKKKLALAIEFLTDAQKALEDEKISEEELRELLGDLRQLLSDP